MTLTFLSGCAASTPDIDVGIAPEIVCTDPPKADPVVMRSVEPSIYIDEADNPWVIVSIREYENLSLNFQDVLAHIKQKNSIIKYYRGCIDEQRDPD
jgi:hypothetical protein